MQTCAVDKPSADSRTTRGGHSWTKACIASGIFLLVLGIYVLTGPGRIDVVDGEARFDVTLNWLVNGKPILRDSWITPFMSVAGRDGLRYSYYGAPASVFAMPLVWLGLRTGAPAIQRSQFLFSLTSSVFGAGIAPILFLFYLELDLTVQEAFVWTMVGSFATLVWPMSTSTYDNAQHAFWAFAAVYLAFVSAKRKSGALAAAGGLCAGILILYQDYFLLIVPALALAAVKWESVESLSSARTKNLLKLTMKEYLSAIQAKLRELLSWIRKAYDGPGDARSSCIRYGLFVAAVGAGVALSLAYNDFRFGSWFDDGKVRFASERGYPLLGNPLAGSLTLLVSPGKSIFLYSPPLILGLLAISQLRRRAPELAAAIGVSSFILLLFLSCISFAGGDWCWGPRYLTVLLPLWALSFPFVARLKISRELVFAIIATGVLVQVLALSVENQRFFFERGLNDFFWAEMPWFYFKHSALFARFGEVISLSQGLPPSAHLFNSLLIPDWTTYTILGPPPNMPRTLAPLWIRNFEIYFLPRPWPLWVSWLQPALRPINLAAWLEGSLGASAVGGGLICLGFLKRGTQ